MFACLNTMITLGSFEIGLKIQRRKMPFFIVLFDFYFLLMKVFKSNSNNTNKTSPFIELIIPFLRMGLSLRTL